MIIGGKSIPGGKKKRQKKDICIVGTSSSMPTITISPEDRLHVKQPHNDALVVSTYIKNYLVKRMLVDDGSTVNVLNWEAFRAMGGSSVELKLITNPITSFCRETVQPMGSVELDIEFRDRDSEEHISIKSLFNIVDTWLAYNRVIGRPIL